MNPNPAPTADDPLALLLLAAWLAVEAAAALLVPLLALLLTASPWRPTRAARKRPVSSTPPAMQIVHCLLPAADPLATLPVVELRRLARAAGHRQLARSGRRADLLAALAVA